MEECHIVSKLVPCEDFYHIQNFVLDKIQAKEIPSEYLIKLRIGNRILCFNILDIHDYIKQNGDIFNTKFGSCLFSRRQLDTINERLMTLGEPIFSPMVLEGQSPIATKRKLEEISTPEQEMLQVIKKAKIETPGFIGRFSQMSTYLVKDIIRLIGTIVSLKDYPTAIFRFCTTSKLMYGLCEKTKFSWPSPWGGEYHITGFLLLNRFLELRHNVKDENDYLLKLFDKLQVLEYENNVNQLAIDEIEQQMSTLTLPEKEKLENLLTQKEEYNIVIQQLLNLVPILINAGIPLDKKDENDEFNTVLHKAAKLGEYKIIDMILKKDPNLIEIPNKFKNKTALMIAIENGHLDSVKRLISNKANINAQDVNGKTILMYAIESGNKEIVDFLLKNHANEKIKDNENKTPLMYAVISLETPMVESLLDKYPEMINSQDFYNTTALIHIAMKDIGLEQKYAMMKIKGYSTEEIEYAMQQSIQAIKLITKRLLETPNINLNIQNDDGYTAVHAAVFNNNIEVLNQLIKAGADINTHDIEGYTPLTTAAVNRNNDIVIILVNAGADVTEETPFGTNVIQLVEQNQNITQKQKAQTIMLIQQLDVQ